MFEKENLKNPNFFAIACAVAIVAFLYFNENFLMTKEDKENRDLQSWGKVIVVIFLIIRFVLPYYDLRFTGNMSEQIGTGPAEF